MTTANNTTMETEETTTPGVGGIADVTKLKRESVDVVDLMTTERNKLVDANEKNVEVFNDLQKITNQIVSNLTALDGAIAGISEFVDENSTEDDKHVTRLKELQDKRVKTVDELKSANSKRTLLITAIQATEISLNVLNGILKSAGCDDIRKSNLTGLQGINNK